jgi:hypothetical protein
MEGTKNIRFNYFQLSVVTNMATVCNIEPIIGCTYASIGCTMQLFSVLCIYSL